jgi:hypothetical protein
VRDPRLVLFRGPALAFALFLLVSAASGAVLFLLKLGAGVADVQSFYLGSEARFAAPRSLTGILEVALPHLVAIPLVLFAASHVIGFARAVGRRAHAALVWISFGSALAGVGAGFGVRWVSPSIAWLKLGSFVALEVALLGWAALLVALFWPSRAGARARAGAPKRPLSSGRRAG